MRTKPYQYKQPVNRKPRMAVNRLPRQTNPAADPKPLTGYVNGVKATNIEERFARALRRHGLRYRFQVEFRTAVSLPGRARVVDFVVYHGLRYPVEVDGEIAHSTGEQEAADRVREELLNEVFRWKCMPPMRRVKWWQLETQAQADAVVRDMFD